MALLLRAIPRLHSVKPRSTYRSITSVYAPGEDIVTSPLVIPTLPGCSLPEFFRSKTGNWKKLTAFECGVTGRLLTHDQVFLQGRGLAAALIQSGYRRGDVISIILPNIPEYSSVLLGIWDAGLVASPINPANPPGEIKRQLELNESKGIVTIASLGSLCNGFKSENINLKSIIVVGEAESCHSFSEMIKTDTSGLTFPGSFTAGDELAILPFSSGTTGFPKCVQITHDNIAAAILQLTHEQTTTLIRSDGVDQDRTIGLLPFFHMYGTVALLLSNIFLGAHTMTLPNFAPTGFLSALKKHKPTLLHCVTPLISLIANSPSLTSEDFRHCHTIGSGAAPLDKELILKTLDKAGRSINFIEGYGLTEATLGVTLGTPKMNNLKPGSCGPPLASTMTKLVDPDSGQIVSKGENGELWVKGPQVTRGYLKNDEATKEILTSDGWLRTGDVGYYDDEDCLYLFSRLKDVMKVNGFQVSPTELESVIKSHPKIDNAVVIGVPHPRFGEAPLAFITVKKGVEIKNVEEIHSFVKGLVVPYKQLHGGIQIVDSLPINAVGKILRRELLAEYQKFAVQKKGSSEPL